MNGYKNGNVRIIIRNFGYRTDIPIKEAVLEALADDCTRGEFSWYLKDEEVIIEEVIG